MKDFALATRSSAEIGNDWAASIASASSSARFPRCSLYCGVAAIRGAISTATFRCVEAPSGPRSEDASKEATSAGQKQRIARRCISVQSTRTKEMKLAGGE
eukprot:scaffold111772_cov54-Phaeocystis_antarctica.AAC.1